MRDARRWLALSSLVLLALWIPGGASARAAESEGAFAGGRVRWDDGLADLGRQAMGAMPRVREVVAGRLGWTYEGPPVEVVIVRGLERARVAVGGRVPEWAVGVAVSSRALVVVRADLLAAGFGGGLEPVLRHEWVHLSWGWRAGEKRRRLPLWAEEGIAEDVGGGVSVDGGAALDVAVTFDRLLQFRDLETSFPSDRHDADLAYKQSRSWIRHVVSRVGWKPIRDVLEGLLAGGVVGDLPGERPFDREVLLRTGKSIGSWHASWRVALEEEASPWYHLLLRDFQGLIIAALALIGAYAFVGILRRRRRQIADLPDGVLPPESREES